MASLLWGKVYYKECFAGILREEPGDRFVFAYDVSYLNSNNPPIAYNFPLRKDPYINENGLHPFFDNLVAEGWLEGAQTKLIGKREAKRFELLIAFGYDLAGAVSVIDPEPNQLTDKLLDHQDSKSFAVLKSRASLSGVQPKLAAIEKNGILYPAKIGQISTHIIKFPSLNHDDLVINEYLTTLAFKALLPKEDVVDMVIREAHGFDDEIPAIKRFDRHIPYLDSNYGGGIGGGYGLEDGSGYGCGSAPGFGYGDGAGDDFRTHISKIHFEEFNQLLNIKSRYKYDAAYRDMSDFMVDSKACVPTEIYHLYLRILAGILLGNTDMHLKNFAMFHTDNGFRLTPVYDQVAACLYSYNNLALKINNSRDLNIAKLKPENIIKLGEEFGLGKEVINMAVNKLAKNINVAKQVVCDAKLGSERLKNNIVNILDKRWDQTLSLVGKKLLKKQ